MSLLEYATSDELMNARKLFANACLKNTKVSDWSKRTPERYLSKQFDISGYDIG